MVGSELLAQGFSCPAYFQPRPSAAGEKGYDPLASGGSNLGPTSKKLRDQAAADARGAGQGEPGAAAAARSSSSPPPGAASTRTSPRRRRSGRCRASRGRAASSPARVRALVEDLTEGRDLGLLGEPRVNVLLLNLALDARFGAAPAEASAAK